MTLLKSLTCQGREIDDSGQSTGEVCGATFRVDGIFAGLVDSARAAGWKIGYRADNSLDALCPSCAAPDPRTVKALREIQQSGR